MAAAAAAAAEEASTGSAACEPVASVWCRASGTRRRGRRKRRCVHLQCWTCIPRQCGSPCILKICTRGGY
ncbi:hypothetical protein GN956_G16372 [Arapaima gigas]